MDNDHTTSPKEESKDSSTERLLEILSAGSDGGEKKQTFMVDASLLECSQQIKELWLKNKSEANEHGKTPHLTPKQFKICFEWLRSSKICEDGSHGATEDTTLAVYYMIGEAVVNKKLMDQAVDAIIAKLGTKHGDEKPWFPGVEFVNTIYLHSEPDSPGRRLMVDVYVKEANVDWLRSRITPGRDGEQFDSQFVCDLMLALLECRTLSTDVARAYKDPSTGEARSYRTKSCLYHYHAEGESCEALEGSNQETCAAEGVEDVTERGLVSE